MRILLAGASGAVGRPLITQLRNAGHEVIGVTRDEGKQAMLRNLGVIPAVADVLNRDSVYELIQLSKPEVIIHQLTSLSDRDFAANARIRIEGTRNLVDAAQAAGVKRMIAQSISWVYEPGEGPARETEQLDHEAPEPRRTTVEGIAALEAQVREIPESVILRYGYFYGPNTWYAADGLIADQIRLGELKATDGISSFIHVEDAARAACLAVNWEPGTLNIVDDEPAAGTVWLPYYASLLGSLDVQVQAGSNRGERGASSVKAKSEYGWKPAYPSWREGFAKELGGAANVN